jgi:modulator of FtsH protease HflC
MATIKHVSIFLGILALFIIFGCLYTVQEGQRALVLHVGEIVINPDGKPRVERPGLHFTFPLINRVQYFDIRLNTKDVKSSRIFTKEQEYVLVDYYVKWRIEDIALYYKRTSGYSDRAESLLEQKINNSLRAAFGQITTQEVIAGKRGNVMAVLKEEANRNAKELGITVIDVRIKRIDFPKEVTETVFSEMRTKRKEDATKHRSKGISDANGIRAQTDKNVVVKLAQARKQAAEIRAQGQAEAAKIYNDAFSQDKQFYALLRSLEAYKNTFKSKSDLLVLEPDSQFFKYFNSVQGEK